MSDRDQPAPAASGDPVAPARPAETTLAPSDSAPAQSPLDQRAREQQTTQPAPPVRAGDDALAEVLSSGSFANQTWGDFEVGQLIGWGGMGAVYRGRQTSLDRPVAIKVLGKHLSDNESFRKRFLREARAVAQINSPHVVQVHSAGVHEGHHFFVMELIDGIDLARKLKDGFRPSNAAAFDLVLQAARGLVAAGRLGIVHRDIKPANMLITGDGVLKLSDFGLVKLVSDERGQTTEAGLTGTGIIVGTAGYFSPEQGLGERCDQRTDIYALGVVAYELLTGHLPFSAQDTTSIIYQHVHETPRPPRQLNATIHPELDAAVLKCLAKKPDARFQTAAELVLELERLAIAGRISDHGHGAGLTRWLTAAAICLTLIVGASAYGLSRPHRTAPAANTPSSAALAADPPSQTQHQSLADLAGQTAPFPQAPSTQTSTRADADALLLAATDSSPEPSPDKPAVDNTSVPAVDTPAKAPAFAPTPVALLSPPADAVPPAATSEPQATRAVPAVVAPAPAIVEPTPVEPQRVATASAAPTSHPTIATPLQHATPLQRQTRGPSPVDDDPTAVVIAKPLPPAERARPVTRDAYGRYADLVLPGVSQRFRWCPPGRFNMGSPDSEPHRSRDEGIHQVTLTHGFWISDSECTQALWQAVMGFDPSAIQDIEHPVEQVSWQQTQDFIRRLDALVPGAQARLPTEAEWEYAARAGASGASPVALDDHAWYSRTAARETHPPRRLQPNAWGLFDCLGNVGEWCLDPYGEYEKPVTVDPLPTSGGGPVIRGGSFRDGADDCRAAHREHARASYVSDRVGFRLAADALPGQAADE